MSDFQIKCSYCSDCLPCPVGIIIPKVFQLYNQFLKEGESGMIEEYRQLNKNADDCTRCGACEKHCSQRIGISAMMFEIAEEFE